MKSILLTLMVFGIVGCSKEIPFDRLVERNSVYYEINSQKPFRRIAVTYYENGQLEYKVKYKNGERHGLSEWYYEN